MDLPPLIAGPYSPPLCRIGDTLTCAIRGRVVVGGLTDGPVIWPTAASMSRHKPLVVCGDLRRALETESTTAVARWWGVSTYYVSRLRAAIGLVEVTPGSRAWRSGRIKARPPGSRGRADRRS